jgi:predicted HicB family RNase H-like nuclease
MKTFQVKFDDETHTAIKIKAAKADISMHDWIVDVLKKNVEQPEAADPVDREDV